NRALRPDDVLARPRGNAGPGRRGEPPPERRVTTRPRLAGGRATGPEPPFTSTQRCPDAHRCVVSLQPGRQRARGHGTCPWHGRARPPRPPLRAVGPAAPAAGRAGGATASPVRPGAGHREPRLDLVGRRPRRPRGPRGGRRRPRTARRPSLPLRRALR